MLEAILQSLNSLVTGWVDTLTSEEVIIQIGISATWVVVAWLLHHFLRRLLRQQKIALEWLPWNTQLTTLVNGVAWPVLTEMLMLMTIALFEDQGWPHVFLTGVNFFVGLWLLYSFLAALLVINLLPAQADVWKKKVMLPLAIIAGALQVLGLVDDLLGFSIAPYTDVQVTIGSIFTGVVTLIVFWLGARGIGRYLRRTFLPQVNADRALSQALSALISYIIIFLGVIFALQITGVNLTALTVIAGGLSVGFGFGLQEIVSNFVSGFILMFERSIGPGDVLKIDDTVGVVKQINVRSMLIRTQDNVELVVPNSKFLTETVTNLTRSQDVVRIRISVGVSYNADPRQVEQVLLMAAKHPRVLEAPTPTVQFMAFGDSSLNFDLLVWTDNAARIVPLASDLRYNIWEALKANNIEIPFPQRDLHIRSGVPWDSFSRPTNGSRTQSSTPEAQ